MKSNYTNTNITKLHDIHPKGWLMKSDEAYDAEVEFLDVIVTSCITRLSEYFECDLQYRYEDILLIENIIISELIYNKNDKENISLAYDLYFFLGNALAFEAQSDNNKMSWVLCATSTQDLMNDTIGFYDKKYFFSYRISGFRGKYLGRDPNLFYLVEELITQLTNGTYTNLLSAKFKELAPYTHKRAPKD